ncbi:putative sugar transporter [Hypoxylon fuscum]|nr:putative sugar transporter [Hypoxylon fuscum]
MHPCWNRTPLLFQVSLVHFGYDQAISVGGLISPGFIKTFPEAKDSGTPGITSSCSSLGASFGYLTSFFFGDRLGQKKTIYFEIIFNVVGVVLQIAAYHLPQMIVGRLFNGFGSRILGYRARLLPLTVESTRWRLLKGRFQEARVALAHGLDDKKVKDELRPILSESSSYARLLAGANASLHFDAAFLCLALVEWVGRRKLVIFAKVPWVFISEINSVGWRVREATAATAMNRMSGLVTVQSAKDGIDNPEWMFYFLFGGLYWSYLPIIFRNKMFTQRGRPREPIEAEQRRISEALTSTPSTNSLQNR